MDECVWSIGGMILTGETGVWSIGGMILTGETGVWSIGGMILTRETGVLREKHTALVVDG